MRHLDTGQKESIEQKRKKERILTSFLDQKKLYSFAIFCFKYKKNISLTFLSPFPEPIERYVSSESNLINPAVQFKFFY